VEPSDTSTRARRQKRHPLTKQFEGKFTAEVRTKILQALAGGATFTDAAVYAGITRVTLHEWMRIGRENDPPPEYAAFMAEVDEAMVSWKVGATTTLTGLGMNGNSRSIEFLLERKFPDEFGRRTRVEHGNADGEPFRVQATPLFDPDLLSSDELDTVIALLAKARPESAPQLPRGVQRVIEQGG
jgi:hypothetical protein